MDKIETPGPLHNYRVLDFGWVLAGPIPGMVLADTGAQVIW
jgi:crotonobetainyl-CoA:carnitine CoA-transferase CaiB-like acyl-CoA transferase